jgi:hypothetical protein
VKQIDAVTLDYLNIELISALRRSSKVADLRKREREDHMIAAGVLTARPLPPPLSSGNSSVRESVLAARTAKTLEDEEEALGLRLELLGMQIGGNIAERSAG